jgi:hypothetical protein
LGVLVVFVEEKWFWREMVGVDCILFIYGAILFSVIINGAPSGFLVVFVG